jgi:hypothetical protein
MSTSAARPEGCTTQTGTLGTAPGPGSSGLGEAYPPERMAVAWLVDRVRRPPLDDLVQQAHGRALAGVSEGLELDVPRPAEQPVDADLQLALSQQLP